MRMGNFWAYIAVLPVFSLLYWLAEYLDDAEEWKASEQVNGDNTLAASTGCILYSYSTCSVVDSQEGIDPAAMLC